MNILSTTSSALVIRQAIVDDIPSIQAIAQQTWPVTYQHIISAEQITYMLNWMYTEEALAEQMFNGNPFFLAEREGQALGFTSFGSRGNGVFRLNKLYVLPTAQTTGAGKLLLQTVVNKVIEANGMELQLQVNRLNKAVGFYQKMGFNIIESFDFDIGNGFFMEDHLMSLVLN